MIPSDWWRKGWHTYLWLTIGLWVLFNVTLGDAFRSAPSPYLCSFLLAFFVASLFAVPTLATQFLLQHFKWSKEDESPPEEQM